jgi:FHA domain
MSFLEKLLRRKAKSRPQTPSAFPGNETEQAEAAKIALEAMRGGAAAASTSHRFPKLTDSAGNAVTEVVAKAGPVRAVKEPPAAAVNIWDIEDEAPPAPVGRGEAAAADAAPRRRANRTKTRMLGFEPQETSVVPLFDEGGKVAEDLEPADKSGVVMFPTGWLIVKGGAGRGAAFPLTQGVSTIGRGGDQAVSLDYGDMAISRSNHAAIAYDATTHRFHIGHGGKSNLVRLNGRPLLSTEAAQDGDEIQIGETTLVLKVLCTPEFNWSNAQSEGDTNDMAIA